MQNDVILVAGGTGNVGSYIVDQLSAEGHQVRALTTARRDDQPGIEYVQCDVSRDDLGPVFEGVAAAFLMVPIRPDMVAVGERLNEAAVAAGAKRIVRLSAATPMQVPSSFVGMSHGAIDAHLLSLFPDALILRPHGFMQNLLHHGQEVSDGRLAQPIDGDSRDSMIDARDISASAVAGLVGDYVGIVDITGPESLSAREVAQKLGEVIGRDVEAVSVLRSDAKKDMMNQGMPDWLADAILEMQPLQERGVMAITTSGVEDLTGRPPRELSAFIEDNKNVFMGDPGS
ncbi:NmrA family NAD(P)-binding protein [Roseobacter weihaiensis]|uniref:NmrA family NAD(P)-binding protein n=1 Tax=Roseobacter weihaiensis TaxID=2763262 RepID=UPI001D0B5BB3|nr:NAD(P)H-binding protein [Roseobacter sp. H9]